MINIAVAFLLSLFCFNSLASSLKSEHRNEVHINLTTVKISSFISNQALSFEVLIKLAEEIELNKSISLSVVDKEMLIRTNPNLLYTLSRLSTVYEESWSEDKRSVYFINSPHERELIQKEILQELYQNSLNYLSSQLLLAQTVLRPRACLRIDVTEPAQKEYLNKLYLSLNAQGNEVAETLRKRINSPFIKKAMFETVLPGISALLYMAVEIPSAFSATLKATTDFYNSKIRYTALKEIYSAVDAKIATTTIGVPLLIFANVIIQAKSYSQNPVRLNELKKLIEDTAERSVKLSKKYFNLSAECLNPEIESREGRHAN